MFHPTDYVDIRDVISSPEFPGGILPCGSPDGPTIDPSGPAPALANLIPQPERVSEMTIPETSGPNSSGSSESADLTRFLANRLSQRLGTVGSMEYRETWKEKVTPLGRLYWAHIASARPTSDNACTGWPTPEASDSTGGRVSSEVGGTRPSGAKRSITLGTIANLAGWGTPSSRDGKDSGPALEANPDMVETAGRLPRQVPGATSTSSPAGTGKKGVLNPAHSLWLLGFPSDWLMAAPVKASRVPRASRESETRSSPGLPQNLSARQTDGSDDLQ